MTPAIAPTLASPFGAEVALRNLCLHVGAQASRFEAVTDLSLRVAPGEVLTVLGPSGCGKSTLLKALAGFLRPSAGKVEVAGEEVTRPSPSRGLVFQQHALFPWKTVLENVAFGLKMRGVSRAEREARARELLDQVGLRGFEGRYPAQLSGGMQQRVEIARVLINRPRLLLMDEPFGALDAQTRLVMQQLLLDIAQRLQPTIVFVTHDIDEALFLGDRVLVMSARPGRVVAESEVSFARPREPDLLTSSAFVAQKKYCFDLVRQHAPRAPEGRDLPGDGALPSRGAFPPAPPLRSTA